MTAIAQQFRARHFSPDVLARYPGLAEVSTQIGHTPLVEIDTPNGHGRIYAKCEWHNPHGSIKDRVALAMIWSALSNGFRPVDATILEYSGGQLAVAVAHMCQLVGTKSYLVLSDGTPASLVEQINGYGGTVEFVPKKFGFWGVMERAFELHRIHSGWHFLYQHENPANLAMHQAYTASEIIDQLSGRKPDAWIAAIGTGGTLMGVLSGLIAVNPTIKAYGVTPSEMPYGTEQPPNATPKFSGSGGLGNGRKQQFLESMEHCVAGHFHFSYVQCLTEMSLFYDRSGIRIGSSAAACLLAARQVARQLGRHAVITTLFPSAGTAEEWQSIERGEARFEGSSI